MEVDGTKVLAQAQATLGAQLMEIIKLQTGQTALLERITELETENAALKAKG